MLEFFVDGHQSLVKRHQALGYDAGSADHGDEIRVAHPAGNDVDVQVIFHSSPGGLSKIPADIESLGFYGDLKQLLRVHAQAPEVENLFLGDLRHFADLPAGNGHEMPGGVGVFVHHKKSRRPARHNKVRGVVACCRSLGKEVHSAAVLGLEILDAPRRPQRLNFLFWKWLVHQARMPALPRGGKGFQLVRSRLDEPSAE